MSIENSRSSSIDGQWIRDNEAKEFEYGYSRSEDAKTAYQKILERLALIKIRNELMFKGMLDAQLRSFARDGITITREQLIHDIDKEVISQLAKQQLGFDLDSAEKLDTQQLEMDRLNDSSEKTLESVSSQTQAQINSLKNNLSGIFGTDSVQEEKPISASENISRESFKEASVAPIQSKQPISPSISIPIEPTIEQVRQGLESHNQQVQQEQQNKDTLINGIIGRMADAGEFSHIPLEDVSQRVDTMNMVKKRLQEKSLDELEIILNSYANQEEITESTGMHR